MNHQYIEQLIKESLRSECQNEARFALIMSRILAMREALNLESAIQDDVLRTAMIDTGVTTLDSAINILALFWDPQEEDR